MLWDQGIPSDELLGRFKQPPGSRPSSDEIPAVAADAELDRMLGACSSRAVSSAGSNKSKSRGQSAAAAGPLPSSASVVAEVDELMHLLGASFCEQPSGGEALVTDDDILQGLEMLQKFHEEEINESDCEAEEQQQQRQQQGEQQQ